LIEIVINEFTISIDSYNESGECVSSEEFDTINEALKLPRTGVTPPVQAIERRIARLSVKRRASGGY